jgi:protocatechuate 3,4-dioxygenase beta subunit
MTRTSTRWLIVILLVAGPSVRNAAQTPKPPPRPGGVIGTPIPGQIAVPPRDTPSQPVSTGTGIIRGRVIASVTNAPLRRVQMSLGWSENRDFRRTVITDPQGRYEFKDLPAGKFTLSASKPGYVGLQYGQRRPYETGTPIVLDVGETAAPLDFALPRGSVIAGRIIDEFGEVMPQVQVQAQRFQYTADAQRRLQTAGTATTDDRGEFRVYGLMPGEYVVSGSIRSISSIVSSILPSGASEPADGYLPSFYPGTPNANDAQPITLGIGEEFNVQFALTPGRFARVSGTVRDSEGRPASGEVIMLPRQGQFVLSNIAQLDSKGTFLIRDVAPGQYSLEVRKLLRGSEGGEGASVSVTIAGSDITDLSITTTKAATITGQVTWEGTAPKNVSGPLRLRVGALNVDQSLASLGQGTDPKANGELDDTGSFQLGGVFGRVLLSMGPPNGWAVKSVTLDGRDITNVPLDTAGQTRIDGVRIILTDKLTNVSGHVTDAKGVSVRQYVVVVQPADERGSVLDNRDVTTVRPDTNGRFELRALRPGRYFATAIEALEQGRQFSPDFRRLLRRDALEFSLRDPMFRNATSRALTRPPVPITSGYRWLTSWRARA